MAGLPLSSERVEQALVDFQDPETGRSVVQLEQIQEIKVEDHRVELSLGLTTFSAPLWEQTRDEVVDHLRSRLPDADQIEVKIVEHHRPPDPIGEAGLAARCVVAVGSGKGGVGKSTIATILALGLARAGCKVGLMDADIHGPSIPLLLGRRERPRMIDHKIEPIAINGMKVMSIGYLVPSAEAIIWRGPMLHSAIAQFLKDTAWGELDYLIIDLPPGTGDVPLSLAQLLPLAGTVVVSTPQDVALADAEKAVQMYRKVKLDVLGMVENMSYFICPNCQSRHEVFGHGGAQARAAQLGVTFLGEVPINVQLRIHADQGRMADGVEHEATKDHLDALCRNLVSTIVARRRANPPRPLLQVL